MAGRILVVEDQGLTRSNISEFLRSKGYEVDEAGDGAKAMELLTQHSVDVVISDFVIPRMHGLKLVDEITSKSPQTRIILMTAYLSTSSAKIILKGMAEIIEKPFALDTLLSIVERLLRPKVLLAALVSLVTL